MSAPELPAAAPRLPRWAIPVLIAALAALQIAAFRWGVIMPDTVVQYRQVLSGDYADWHPPVTAWLWRWIGGARFGSAPLLLLDLGLYWLGLGLIADALRRRGWRWRALLPLAIGALPIPFGQMGAILKDSLLAACLTAAAGIVGWHMLQQRAMHLPARVAMLGLLAIAAATRFNAPLACAPLLLLALPSPPRALRWTVVALIPALAILFAANLLIDQVLLRPHAQHPFLSQVNIDLAGISLWSGDNVYPASARPPMALLAACYTPAQFNPRYDDACNAVEDGLHALYDEHPGAVALWLGAIARHPIAHAEHRLAHFNANQRWLVARVPDDAVYIATTPNDVGLRFTANRLALAIHRAATRLAWSPPGRPATWLAVAAALLLLAPSPLPRALALSALLYGGGYAVASVAPDLRYNLWTMLAAILACIVALAPGQRVRLERRRSFPAALIMALAIGGEMWALSGPSALTHGSSYSSPKNAAPQHS